MKYCKYTRAFNVCTSQTKWLLVQWLRTKECLPKVRKVSELTACRTVAGQRLTKECLSICKSKVGQCNLKGSSALYNIIKTFVVRSRSSFAIFKTYQSAQNKGDLYSDLIHARPEDAGRKVPSGSSPNDVVRLCSNKLSKSVVTFPCAGNGGMQQPVSACTDLEFRTSSLPAFI